MENPVVVSPVATPESTLKNRSSKENIVWHYTHNNSMFGILKDWQIKPATTFVDTSKEQPIVWFSKNPHWERTVARPFDPVKCTLAPGTRLFRIGVPRSVAPHNWTALRLLSGMDSRTANGLVRTAKEWGADPLDWFGSFESVASDKWESVEEFLKGKWMSFMERASAELR